MSHNINMLIKELRERTGIGLMECKKALINVNYNIELAIDNMRKLGKTKAVKKSGRITTEGIILAKITNNNQLGILLELNCETDFVAKDIIFLTFGNNILKFIINNNISNINELNSKVEEERNEIITKTGENINIKRFKILKGKQIGYYLHGVRIGVIISTEGANVELIKHLAMHIAAYKPEYITPKDIPKDIIIHERQIQLDIAIKSNNSHNIAEKIVIGRMNKFIQEICLTEQEFIFNQKKTVDEILKENNTKVIAFHRFEVGEK